MTRAIHTMTRIIAERDALAAELAACQASRDDIADRYETLLRETADNWVRNLKEIEALNAKAERLRRVAISVRAEEKCWKVDDELHSIGSVGAMLRICEQYGDLAAPDEIVEPSQESTDA